MHMGRDIENRVASKALVYGPMCIWMEHKAQMLCIFWLNGWLSANYGIGLDHEIVFLGCPYQIGSVTVSSNDL